ncbi:kelch-like protein 1 [Rhagoletis pomonella]|uniref:kelch-like protein 1 n=1 Tax=Rhagoletis pomonella TaxID=28610 RepID=UPI0017857828|nr:kelch-like protein 1 [Rhagoletis pomonella]
MATNGTRQLLLDVNGQDLNHFIKKLLNNICDFYDEQDLIDVTFKLSNPTAMVPAHRLILSAASPYFKDLFKSDKGLTPVIEVNDIDSDTFERLITFCYTGQTLVTIDNVDAMLKAALYLKLDEAVVNCVDYILEHITDYTLQRAYSLERETQCVPLYEKLLEYDINNFMEISKHREFLSFDAEKLQAIIESHNLNVTCEEDAFYAVKQWYEYDASGRKHKLPDLISRLRLTLFDTSFLLRNVQTLPGCESLAFKATSWISLPSQRALISLKYTEPRRNVCVKEEETTLLAVQAYCEEDAFHAVKQWYEYDSSGRQQKLPDLISSLRLTNFDLNFLLRNVQILPGCESLAYKAISWISLPSHREMISIKCKEPRRSICNKSVETTLLAVQAYDCKGTIFQYNQPEDEWQNYAEFEHDANRYGMVLMEDNIIYIGGVRDGKITSGVESWSLKTKSWNTLPSMIQSRYFLTVVLLNGNIYAIGGLSTDNQCTKSVEKYSTGSEWELVSSMNTPRCQAGAVALNDKIFVFGGFDGKCHLKSVECYDPSSNTWIQCADMNESHNFPGAAVHKGCIYVLGGLTENKIVERYDPQSNNWTKVSYLHIGRGAMGCVSKDDQLWVVGGEQNKNMKYSVSVYYPECNKWVRKKSVPVAHRYSCYVVPKTLLQSE